MLYLALNFFSMIVPLVFSFHPKIKFYQKFAAFLPALALTAILFIVWDDYFTKLGVWGFNDNYTIGLYIQSLPVEELLFFICIPFACVFTYFTIKKLKPTFIVSNRAVNLFSIALLLLGVASSILNADKLYTFYTSVSLVIVLGSVFIFKRGLLNSFYPIFLILLLPFFIVNGILTGTAIDDEVVWYNNAENLGIRLGTIPIEDGFYAFVLILLTVFLTEVFAAWRKPAVAG